MVEEYNPSTDNYEQRQQALHDAMRQAGLIKEEPRLNPSTNISNFTRPEYKQRQSIFLSRLGLKKRTAGNIMDRIKVLRFQNALEKRRLQNQIQRLKLAKRIQRLKQQGVLKQTASMPIIKRKYPMYPAYATREVAGDIDSAFFGDFGHADRSLWGDEDYYDENFYTENYYGTEFDNDPLFHLGINKRDGVSPLMW